MSKHTPTPWDISRQSGDEKDDFLAIYSKRSTSQPIAVLFMGETDEWSTFKGYKENAAFIVRACNSHDELVKALENALRESAYIKDRGWKNHALKALAKAKGEA